ncbi:MAG: MarR family winged helix-turn-helix transcriptional regulator [Hyphomicrobiaceae bacterium]
MSVDKIPVLTSGCTCLRLRKAARRVSQIYDQHLQRFGLTVTQYGLLGHVRLHDGIGIGALAEMLVMDPTTLTRNMRPLIRRGLVVMAPNPADRRNRNLHLTAAGREEFAGARSGWEAAQREIAAVLGEKDGPALAATIDRMLERLSG